MFDRHKSLMKMTFSDTWEEICIHFVFYYVIATSKYSSSMISIWKLNVVCEGGTRYSLYIVHTDPACLACGTRNGCSWHASTDYNMHALFANFHRHFHNYLLIVYWSENWIAFIKNFFSVKKQRSHVKDFLMSHYVLNQYYIQCHFLTLISTRNPKSPPV